MAPTNSSLLLAGGLGLLIGVGGGATGALLVERGQPTGPERRTGEGVDPGTISSAIEKLTVEMRAFRASIELHSGEPSTPGEMRVQAANPATERLERAISRLTEVLESPRASSVPFVPAAGVEHERIQPKQTARLEELRAMKPEERSQVYFFWSLQDVLDRFGRPDGFWPQEGGKCSLHYDLGDDHAVDIMLVDGLVFGVYSS
jgi:hypothetical protein